ncbi:MAG TPA: phenylalanine--tRNA ligase subunit beta [Candidatus Sulfopaludibacter sp.]|jgi:phenylalanyl-tRNA synthetase beta chain|nr:phenylalanine--tRNA ligase subunit beta [Candidatus Sulfopaludibacter sp.]
MKFSYNWIRESVDDLNCAPAPLERLITMKTAECEGIEPAGELLAEARVARVETVEPIEGSHNVKAVVDAGPLGRKTVVCGAPNCRPGLLTAYVPIGKKVINGVESDGMLASGAELGINRDHTGIVELQAEVGAPIPGCQPDSVIEIDNKSITHRPDLWGHHGMAREVAAILGHKLKDPARLDLIPTGAPAVQVSIADFSLCPRYSALVFENVTIQPSPLWLQARLSAIGLNPINNIVDMTNYVMSELAQPMHAFDADKLQGGTIFVRPAAPGEHFTALNDEEYTLDASNLVIADAGGPIALAGVIGGAHSAIGDATTRVVLESANFDAVSVRRTSSAIKLRTDASMRFEKAQDPANTVRGIARAIELLQEISPGIRMVGGMADEKKLPSPPPPIELPLEWLRRKLGRAMEAGEVRTILERLQFGVAEPQPGVFSVTVPSWRATKDISIKDDLVEEVGRMIGYDSITPQAPLVPASVPPGNPARKFQHEVRNIFVDQGFTEVYNYSFLSEEAVRAFGFDPADHVRVTNPIASNQALMRTSLLPGIWSNVLENAKHRESFRLFEIGLEIHKSANPAELPVEIPHLVAALYDRQGDGAAGLFEVKRAAECLMPGAEAVPAEARAFEHPARAAEIVWKGRRMGRLFELHPALVETGRAAILDLDLDAVRAASAGEIKYTPIRRYPSSAFDLSVVAGLREHAGKLHTSIAGFAGPLLESVQFQRRYAGPPLPEGMQSVSFRVTVGSAERTLSNDEITAIRGQIIDGMRGLGYDLRV